MEKKIVYAVYHDVNHEARSMELLHCCKMMGKVDFVSYKKPNGVDNITTHLINKKSPFALFHFIAKIKKVIAKVQPDIIVLHDYDCAAVIPYAKKRCKNAKIVYDSSELYIPFEGKRRKVSFNDGLLIALKQKIASFRPRCEKKYLKYADVVLAANEERAKIMKEYFSLPKMPLVFDNIHRIDDNYNKEACDKKWSSVFTKDTFNILFAGGISEERQTFDYINAFDKLGAGYRLIILGMASDVALKKFETMPCKNKENIFYLGYMTRAELRYCIQNSHASVVLFDKKSYNTLYCASGKFYESLFEGVPILASENPPLKRVCTEEKIGVSDDDFARGIQTLQKDYDAYVLAVRNYVGKIRFEDRIENLHRSIMEVL